MFNNGFNNLKSNNTSNPLNQPTLTKPTLDNSKNIMGISKSPANISGINKMPTANNPFNNVKIDRQLSKQVMNSSGENVIRNDINKNGGFNGN